MKYKKQIITSAIALSLFVGGSKAMASAVQDQTTSLNAMRGHHQMHPKHAKRMMKFKGNHLIGTVSVVNSGSFIITTENPKTKEAFSFDVKTDTNTVFYKDGAVDSIASVQVGQKVIVAGTIDQTAKTVIAKKVNVVTKIPAKRVHKLEKWQSKGE